MWLRMVLAASVSRFAIAGTGMPPTSSSRICRSRLVRSGNTAGGSLYSSPVTIPATCLPNTA
nr:hypothetical protein [Kibdelosporangium sp. MJ126-NF4]CTQ95577.1 hypothetical protein [Kibdelosporangium sp. MJ126-NF4]